MNFHKLYDDNGGIMNFEKFAKLKTVKRELLLDETCDKVFIESLIVEICKNKGVSRRIDDNISNSWGHLAYLIKHAKSDEILDAILWVIKEKGGVKAGATLELYSNKYGPTLGKLEYQKYISIVSNRNAITSSNEYQFEKNSERAIKNQQKRREVNSQNMKSMKDIHGNLRFRSPLCREYTKYIGLDNNEIERLIKIEKLKSYVYRSKEDKAHIYEKTKKTKLENQKNGKYPRIFGYSKEAVKFFDRVLFKLPSEIASKVISFNTTQSEYWFRDKDNSQKYYFADFCIPGILVVEFNGHAYHPKCLDDDFEILECFVGPKNEKYLSDRQKISSIEKSGHAVLEVWNDEYEKANVEEVVKFIMEKCNEAHSLVI